MISLVRFSTGSAACPVAMLQAIKDEILGTGESSGDEDDGEEGSEDESGSEEDEQEQQKMQIQVSSCPDAAQKSCSHALQGCLNCHCKRCVDRSLCRRLQDLRTLVFFVFPAFSTKIHSIQNTQVVKYEVETSDQVIFVLALFAGWKHVKSSAFGV